MSVDPSKNSGHYIHKITYNYRERVVGLFVFSAFILFSALIVISGKSQHLFENRVTFYLDVESSEGINQGSIVTALGSEVGTVTALNYGQKNKIRVTIEVYEGQRNLIRTGAKATVNRLANITNALIEIESGSIDETVLANDSVIPVVETPSLNDLLLGIANIIQAADNNELLTKFETMLPKLELTIENAHKIITQIASGHGVLGAAVFDYKVEKELKSVVTSGAKILSEAESIISIAKQRLIQLEPLLTDMHKITNNVQGATQDLPAMVVELNNIIAQANIALALINGELHDIPGTTVEVRRAVTKADHLLDSVQNIWPLSQDVEKANTNQLIPIQPSYE
ncbi:MAG: MlaD family protein [Methylococcaceae bacterium]